MKCEQARDTIVRDAAGDRMPSSEIGALEAHLSLCAECRAERESARAVIRRMRAASPETVPFRTRRALAELVLGPEDAARVLPEPALRLSWLRRYGPPLAAAALFLIALTAMLWPKTKPPDRVPETASERPGDRPKIETPLSPADRQWGGALDDRFARLDGQVREMRGREHPREGPREQTFEQRIAWVAEQIAMLERQMDKF